MLPEEDGLSILRKLRAAAPTRKLPVIILTAKNTEYDRVVGLDGGADDFISKPFGMMELLARVRAVLRRAEPSGDAGGVQIGVLYICPPQHIVRVNGKNVQLTNKEFEILCLLVENRGIVLTRGTLMDKVWGFDCDRENRTLDVHIRRSASSSAKLVPASRPSGASAIRSAAEHDQKDLPQFLSDRHYGSAGQLHSFLRRHVQQLRAAGV